MQRWRTLGILRNQPYQWQREVRATAGRAFPFCAPYPELADEVTRLQWESGRLKKQRDILGTAVAFFAKKSSWGIGSSGAPKALRRENAVPIAGCVEK